MGNIDLPRKVVYRKRKGKKPVRVDKQCHVDRTYEDFQKYKEENPDIAVVEMDSVESSRDSSKVLLTLHFCSCNLMLAFLRDANTARSVTDVFNCLQEKLEVNLLIHPLSSVTHLPVNSAPVCSIVIRAVLTRKAASR